MAVIGFVTASGATICVDCATTLEREDEIATADAIHGHDQGAAVLDCTDCGDRLLDVEEYVADESWRAAA
jgi:hypothetical protein